jgi:hypothetical protein
MTDEEIELCEQIRQRSINHGLKALIGLSPEEILLCLSEAKEIEPDTEKWLEWLDRRSEAVAMGRALDAQDQAAGRLCRRSMGGATGLSGPVGRLEANAYYRFIGNDAPQVPNLRGPGGYSSLPGPSTPPTAIMAAQQMGQQQVARGGEIAVDPAALAEATARLGEC